MKLRFLAAILTFVMSLGVWADEMADTLAVDTTTVDTTAVDSAQWANMPLVKLTKAEKRALRKQFVPNPQRALWLAAVLPGAGQIYNRKYWKLPIFYGGFLGCVYAFTWNQQMYKDYSQAYLDIMDDNPNTKSYEEMLPHGYSIEGREEQFKKIFKNKKDYYRRYRDLSGFCFIGVYILSIVDAYVDAQLSSFDISRDLSLRLNPAVIEQPGPDHRQSYGVGCSFNIK